MQPTPEFVAWTLSLGCLLREDTDIADPEQTERQLRVLRTYADAVSEGRYLDGICVDAACERGFRAADVLEAYGGEEFVAQQCRGCPANTVADRVQGALAGCFGWLVLDQELTAALGAGYQRLWIEATPERALIQEHLQRFTAAVAAAPSLVAAVAGYQAALERALQFDLPLHWRMYPAGQTDGQTWRIAAHCPRCKAPMHIPRGRCVVCNWEGASEPERRRKARGQRPYTPLAKFLGQEGAADIVQRYRASRGELQ